VVRRCFTVSALENLAREAGLKEWKKWIKMNEAGEVEIVELRSSIPQGLAEDGEEVRKKEPSGPCM
jgi:hypothetical protein